MTAAEQCRRDTGLTLAEAARRIGKSRQTLYDWHRDSPERFAAALKEAKDVQVDQETPRLVGTVVSSDSDFQ
jgi:DNA-binding XRE family transcriptional regulator